MITTKQPGKAIEAAAISDPYADGPTFPGGTNAIGYRIAFVLYVVCFLLTLTAGLVNFLGTFFKNWR